MPHHLISGMHEWMNKIPTVPTYHPAKPNQENRVGGISKENGFAELNSGTMRRLKQQITSGRLPAQVHTHPDHRSPASGWEWGGPMGLLGNSDARVPHRPKGSCFWL